VNDEANGVLVQLHRSGWTVTEPNEHRPDGSVSSRGHIDGYGDTGWEKYVQPGTPVVNTRTIPQDKLVKWVFQSPMVDPDLGGIRGAKVEQDFGSFGKDELEFISHMHPTFQAISLIGNNTYVSVEEYVALAMEWGATCYRYELPVDGECTDLDCIHNFMHTCLEGKDPEKCEKGVYREEVG